MSETQTHTFQAEIQQLLDIVIHSVYTDKEVFVRELISNAADACEKFRFRQSGGDAPILEPEVEPRITVALDEEANTVTITDTGIGMTEAQLAKVSTLRTLKLRASDLHGTLVIESTPNQGTTLRLTVPLS